MREVNDVVNVNKTGTYRMVMGIELRSSLSCSTCCTCFRNETKWLLSIS